MDRIGLLVELLGGDKALNTVEKLKQAKDQLNNSKISLTVERAGIDRQISAVKKNLDDLANKKREIRLSGGKGLKEVDKEILEARRKLADLTERRRQINVEMNLNTEGIRQAQGAIRELEQNAYTLQDVLSGIGRGFSGIGSALTSLGNTFGGNLLSKISTTLTAYGTIMATQGLKNSTERYDIMTTFPKLMSNIGYTTEEAETAVSRMNEAVLGLPTSLSEMVDSSKQYIMLLGDIERGTDLAIAANNAFLANASDSTQVYHGMKQIRDILAKGDLRTMEWESLFSALGTSLGPIAEKLGYTSDEIGEFRTAVTSGEVAAMDFVNALIEAGSAGGVLAERAEIQKETLNATLTNIKNAFSITGFAILEELDSIFTEYTGKSLPENIKRVSDWIKEELKPSITGWMDENGDEIMGFFSKLSEFDWMKLASSIGQGLVNTMTVFGNILSAIPQDLLIQFVTFATVYASPLGRAFSLLGAAFSIAASIKFPVGAFTGLGNGVKAVGTLMGGLKGIAQGFVGATAFIAIIAEIGAVIWELAKVAETISTVDLSGFEKNMEPIARFGGVISGLALALTTIGGAFAGSGIGAAVVGGGMALGAGFTALVGEIGLVIGVLADTANKLGSARMPTEAQLERFRKVIDSFGEIFTYDFQGIFRTDKSLINTVKDGMELIETIANDLDMLDAVANSSLSTDKLKNRIKAILDVLKEFYDGIEEMLGGNTGISDMYNNWAQKNVLSGVTEMIGGLSTTIDELNNVHGKIDVLQIGKEEAEGTDPFDALITKIERLVDGVQRIKDAIDNHRSNLDLMLSDTSLAVSNISDSLVETMRNISEMIDIVSGYDTSGLGIGQHVAKDARGEGLGEDRFTKMISDIEAMITSVNGALNSLNSNWGKGDSSLKIKNVAENIKGAMASLGDILATVSELSAITADMSEEELTGVSEKLEGLFEALATLFGSDVFKSFGELSISSDGSGHNAVNSFARMVSSLEQIALAVEQVKGILGMISEMSGSLEEIDPEDLTQIQTIIENINSALAAIPEDAEDIVVRAQALVDAINNIQTIVNTLLGMQESLAAIGEEGTAGLTTVIQGLVSAISGEDIAAASETISALTEMINGVNEALGNLSTIDMTILAEGLSAVSENTQILVSDLEELKGAMETAGSEAQALKADIESMGSAASAQSSNLGALIGSINQVAVAMRGAMSAADGLANAINSIPTSKTVTVNYTQSGSVSTSGPRPQLRASGGPIDWRPHGTDTVPAMLTPGEFVMRRSAVSTLGKQFMERINALDIAGAVKSLYYRRLPGISAPIITNNYSHQRDNHATYNQYNYTNNPSFIYRRASKWVRGLS